MIYSAENCVDIDRDYPTDWVTSFLLMLSVES